MAYLQIQKGSDRHRLELTKTKTIIGRSPDCDLVLDAASVSRQHAQIVCEANSYLLEDLGSHNGTYLNGKRLRERVQLGNGDQLRIADFSLTFHADESDSGMKAQSDVVVADGEHNTVSIVATRDAASLDGMAHVAPAVRPEAKLRAMLGISRDLGAALHLDELLPRILDSVLNLFPQADGGCILLQDKTSESLVPRAVKNRRSAASGPLRVSRTILKIVMESGKAVLSKDAASDERFRASMSVVGHRIGSIMCVPLMSRKQGAMGVIQVHAENRMHLFTQEDLDLLVSVAATAAVAVENARLHEDLLAQDRLQRELKFARDVQRAFLPSECPTVAGYRFYACYEPAHSVGGDYYGFIELPGNRLAISIGDVSGKGLPAALLMAHLASDIRFSAISAHDPAAVVQSVNGSLSEAGLGGRFVTLLFAVLDKTRHTLTAVNAGHLPPMLRTAAGAIEEIGAEKAGLPLNVNLGSDEGYGTFTIPLEPGSLVLLYTDGIIESKNPAGEFFGAERLKEVFASAPPDPAQAGDAIVRAVQGFAAGGGEQHDDITLLCFGVERS